MRKTNLEQINQATIPIIKNFCIKLSFEGETPWMESYSFHYSEIDEFVKVHDINPKLDNLMAVSGFLYGCDGTEYQAYAVYSYDDKVNFLTIVLDDGNGTRHTYDYANAKWVNWTI